MLCESNRIKYEKMEGIGGDSGTSYLIPLSSLSDKEINRYLRSKRKEEVIAARNQTVDSEEMMEIEEVTNYESLSAEERKQLGMYNKILDDWLFFRETEHRKGISYAVSDENYVRILKIQYPDMNISIRTLQRWDKKRREKGDLALVDRRGKHGNHNNKYDTEIFDVFQYYYLDESRKTVSMCATLAKAELRKQGKEALLYLMPSDRTLLRWIDKHIPVPVIEYFRYGEKACKDKCLPYIHRSYEDLESNDIWVCDNHTFDIVVKNGEKPMRVYLTAFLDVKSRKMVGWYVTINPSSDATLFALRKGVERFGIPKRIYSDNGREFLTFDIGGRGFRKTKDSSEDPVTILSRLGIEFKTAMVKNARAKIVERTFRTVKEEFSKLFEAYTGGNVLERPERLKYIEKDITQLVALEDFESFVGHYIEGWYNNRAHKGKGMYGQTPNEVYAKNLHTLRKASVEELNLMLLRSTRLQKVSRSGVKLSFYGHDIFFESKELIIHHLKESVYVRYDPSNLKEVRIYDSQDRYLMNATQVQELSYFASKEEVAAAMKEQRSYERMVKAYKKDKGLKGTRAFELVMEEAQRRTDVDMELNPEIIKIMRSPEYAFNELLIQQAVGAEFDDEPLDFGVANMRIRKAREMD